MNISGIGSVTWTLSQLSSTTSRTGSTSSSSGSSDTATISSEGFAALLQAAGPPPMTDELAATIGASLQEEDPDLFGELDSDSDGTLTASELEAGMDKLGGPPPGGGPPPMTDEMAADFGTRLQEYNPDLFASLDSDSDGVLTADEMEAGKDLLEADMQAKGHGPPPPPPPADSGSSGDSSSSGGLSDDQIQQLLQALQDSSQSDVQTNRLADILQQLIAGSSTAA